MITVLPEGAQEDRFYYWIWAELPLQEHPQQNLITFNGGFDCHIYICLWGFFMLTLIEVWEEESLTFKWNKIYRHLQPKNSEIIILSILINQYEIFLNGSQFPKSPTISNVHRRLVNQYRILSELAECNCFGFWAQKLLILPYKWDSPSFSHSNYCFLYCQLQRKKRWMRESQPL